MNHLRINSEGQLMKKQLLLKINDSSNHCLPPRWSRNSHHYSIGTWSTSKTHLSCTQTPGDHALLWISSIARHLHSVKHPLIFHICERSEHKIAIFKLDTKWLDGVYHDVSRFWSILVDFLMVKWFENPIVLNKQLLFHLGINYLNAI